MRRAWQSKFGIAKLGGELEWWGRAALKPWRACHAHAGEGVGYVTTCDQRDVNGQLVVIRPPEPPNEWKREFYSLFNHRTKDKITVDFEWVEGFDRLEGK